ncbi:MAG: MarR family transcriptional regulator [Firmicutes bacterium]|nr:MarR family transcriptional regulator [Bacillota bacterium]
MPETPSPDATTVQTRLTELFSRVLPHPGDGNARISASQLACLHYIGTHPGSTVTDVAGGLRISNPAATKLVDRLEAHGLVVRLPRTGDRRQVRLALTPRGRETLVEATHKRDLALRRILERMDPEARRALEAGLRGFLEAALQEPADLERVCLQCGTEHVPWCPLNELHVQLTGHALPAEARSADSPTRQSHPTRPEEAHPTGESRPMRSEEEARA